MRTHKLAATAAVVSLIGYASANVFISTDDLHRGTTHTFSTAVSNNGSGGVFFNLEANNAFVSLLAFDVPLGGTIGTIASVEVWTRPGSYEGFTTNSAGWSLTQTVQSQASGQLNPAPFLLTTPIDVPAGTTTGIYIHSVTPKNGIRYTGTNAFPPQTTWSDDHLTLFSDAAKTGITPFGGSTFSPRTFSGSIHYQILSHTLTTAASNNGSGGVFLNLEAGDESVSLFAFDVPLAGTIGTVASVEVWTRPGSYVGFTDNSAGWSLTQTVQSQASGQLNPAPFLLTTPIDVPAGTTTGIYIHSVTASNGIRYTGMTAIPPQTTWGNDHLTLFSDVARNGNIPFGTGQFTPRTFSGSIHYLLLPNHDLIFADGFELQQSQRTTQDLGLR